MHAGETLLQDLFFVLCTIFSQEKKYWCHICLFYKLSSEKEKKIDFWGEAEGGGIDLEVFPTNFKKHFTQNSSFLRL